MSAAALAEEGRRLMGQGRSAEALGLFQHALELEPGNPRLHVLFAWALPMAGRLSEAEEHLRSALTLDPHLAPAHGMLGFRLQERGQFDEAIESFERGIALQPRQAGSYFGIVQSKKISAADHGLVDSMERLSRDPGVPAADLQFLHFGLGKALDDLGEFGRAIGHYDEANRLSSVSSPQPYDRSGNERYVDSIISRFTKEFFERHVWLGSDSELPVFIVGMPRSGTTLVEQILSSHPEVRAGGELKFWRDEAESFRLKATDGPVKPAEARRVANAYLGRLGGFGQEARRVSDKMPINYLFLGPIHLLFPRARIVHCRRHPVDTSLSIYMTRIVPPRFANDRGNIVFGYRQYERLMQHWRAVLPADRFFEIDYEKLVSDRENVTRQLVGFCSLEWSEGCLAPEQNGRAVMTPSLWQARQPVYSSSVERWRNYEPWLGEFRDLLPSG